MLHTIERAVGLYYDQKDAWNKLIQKAMWEDNSWEKSANKYVELYSSLM
jgi:glycogen synthase (ADP-glucose)